ncbi:hypothetical protein [Fundidesulfovibrio soli]|uniref:hypothetical protein n=1 Tax=Fundidesulfovibrio soli TaxID=2922716 RepID=UPI001FAF8625|nr:hypothetical protein [Fundidesulfovibrio soli]
MHRPGLYLAAALTLAAIGLAAEAHAEPKHYQVSQRHFEELADRSSRLAREADGTSDINACNYFTAVAMTYAVRAHVLAQLADLAAQLRQPEDRALARQKLAESQAYTSPYLETDLKMLENLSASTRNSGIRETGMRLLNELRVFARNVAVRPKD